MANPSVTYTFVNGTTADATQVNTNFSDLVAALSDSTKDLNMNNITLSGGLTVNGNSTLGNTTADDVSILGSIAATIPVKTNALYDFGSTTKGLLGVYLGNSTFTGYLTAATLSSSNKVWTFPNFTMTILGADSAQSVSNKTFTDSLLLTQIATPTTPSSGLNKVYPKSDDRLYMLNDSGEEQEIATAGRFEPSRNLLTNTQFEFWQKYGTSTTVAAGVTDYVPDRWFVKNALGGTGVITCSRAAGSSDTARYGCSVLITSVGTTNGCELYQTCENVPSQQAYNKKVSVTCRVLALGNVTSITTSILWINSEAKATSSSATGSLSNTTTINSSTYTTVTLEDQLVSTTMTTSGSVGIGFAINGVSSGNTYASGNGYIIEAVSMTVGAKAADYRPQHPEDSGELQACLRHFQKTYLTTTTPGTVTQVGSLNIRANGTLGATRIQSVPLFVPMRTTPTFTFYSPQTSNASGLAYNLTAAQTFAVGASLIGDKQFSFESSAGGAASDLDYLIAHWVASANI